MENSSSFNRLLNIMDQLRAECPWDQKQTMESLSHLTIEETYELMDAILNNDMKEIKGELGDLLLHIVFYSKIASESDAFDINDVIQTICDKLVERHPHIYGDEIAKTEEDVKKNWEKIKLKSGRQSVLEGVPKSLPAMVKAVRIQEKVRGVGFDWDDSEQVWEKVQEELEELKTEVQAGDKVKTEQEFGDLLFSLINYSRFVGVNPEDSLERTNKKFIQRFQQMEAVLKEEGKDLSDMVLSEMDVYWEQAKKTI